MGRPCNNRLHHRDLFGPLFRFNREFYDLDERGRPVGVCNLAELHRRDGQFSQASWACQRGLLVDELDERRTRLLNA
jgi:hypothetical protein